MSDSDSFIEEVTEEVRRDRLFNAMKRYGPIAAMAVFALVGGAAFNEYRKGQATILAQATGDAVIAALSDDDPLKRAEALTGVDVENPSAAAITTLLAAGEQASGGDNDAAIAGLKSVSDNAELPLIYRQIATFKLLAVQADSISVEDRRAGYEALIGPGSELRLLAEEQLALIDVETGTTEAAVTRLQAIAVDAAATAGLRRRATQLIVALGGTPNATTPGQ